MAARWAALGLIAAAAAWAWSQASAQPVFADRAGNMEVWDANFAVQRIDGDRFTFRAVAKGANAPILARWKRQGREVRAREINGTAASDASRQVTLLDAVLSGNVSVKETRPSSNRTVSSTQELNLTAARAVFAGSDNTWNLEGGVTVTREDPGARQTLRLNGSRAVLKLYPANESNARPSPIQQAEMFGPVRFRSRGARFVREGQEPGRWVPTELVGSADRLEYDDANRQLILTGNVDIDGSEEFLLGRVRADRAVVTFDDQGNAVKLESEGAPGTAQLRDPASRTPRRSPEGSRP